MNNFRHNCRKIILDGKDKGDSTISSKQWEELKETMRYQEYLTKRTRVRKTRNNLKATYYFG